MKVETFVFTVIVFAAMLAYVVLRVIPASWTGLLLFVGIVSVAFMALTVLLDKSE